ncbi:MAG: hypothetical protein AB7L91_17995 [Dehalococcoidia bacterium]
MARVNLTGDVLGDDPPPRPATPPPPPALPPAPSVRPRKFTMLVDEADDDRAHRVVDDVLKRGRIRPTKSMRADVVRALFALADEDPELRARLAARLRDTMPP